MLQETYYVSCFYTTFADNILVAELKFIFKEF
jgi:hypothetical protein